MSGAPRMLAGRLLADIGAKRRAKRNRRNLVRFAKNAAGLVALFVGAAIATPCLVYLILESFQRMH